MRSSSGIVGERRLERRSQLGRAPRSSRASARARCRRRAIPLASTRSSASASGSSPAVAAGDRRERRQPGRRPAARSRSTVRLRAMVCSHAASEPSVRVVRLRPVPQRQERLLHDLFCHSPIRCQPARRREDRVPVTVVERGQRVMRAARDLAHERGVVASPASMPRHRIRPGVARRFRGHPVTTSRPPVGPGRRACRPAGAPRGR